MLSPTYRAMTNTHAEVAMPMTLSPDTAVAPSLGGDAATPSDTIG